jgi:hypothetical protein
MAVLAAALASASGAAQAPGGKVDQYDRFGRLVYGASSGRQLHDDLSPQASAAAAAAPAAAASTLALLPSAPEAASSAAASATGSSLLLEQDWQKASFGTGIGATGLQVADVDADGELEIVAGASKPTFFPNQRFYVLSRQGDTYSHEWASLPYEQEIAGVRVAQADADPALEILVGVASRIEIFDGSTGEARADRDHQCHGDQGLSVADVDADGALGSSSATSSGSTSTTSPAARLGYSGGSRRRRPRRGPAARRGPRDRGRQRHVERLAGRRQSKSRGVDAGRPASAPRADG